MIDAIPLSVLFGILFLLLLTSGFFSGSETALMALNRYKLHHQAQKGHPGARLAHRLLQKPDRLIGLILLGNNLVNILITQLATFIGLRLYGDVGIAIATGVLTFVLLIFAEVAPKTVAAVHSEKVAYPAAFVYTPLLRILYPFVWLINTFANGLLRLIGVSTQGGGLEALTQEELRTIVREADGMIKKDHQQILLRVLEMEERTVDDIMIPRSKISGLDIGNSWAHIENQLIHSKFTRVLVYKYNLDRVIGFLHVRKVLPLLKDGDLDREKLCVKLNKPYYVPEGTRLTQQLLNFRHEHRRVGLVVDEYGELLGLVTLEDILEEIVGEFSTAPLHLSHKIERDPEGYPVIDGSMNIRQLNRELELDPPLPTSESRTINGLVLEHMGSIPVPNFTIVINGYPLEILNTRNNAVKTLLLKPRLKERSVLDQFYDDF